MTQVTFACGTGPDSQISRPLPGHVLRVLGVVMMESNSRPGNAFGYAGNVRIVAELACVVYDEEDGSVVHGHGAVCLEGGEMPDERAFQERAIDVARRSRELGSRRLQTLMVSPAEMSGGPMRVDLGTRRLVALETQPPARS